MIITIDSNFYASPSTRLLGNYGETMSRSIAVCYPLVEGASLYKLRFLLPDLKSCYEADVTLGSMAVSGSLLSQTGKLSCQWIAAGINEQGEYSVVAKSNVFSLVVGESIESDSAEPVPTYEQAAEMFDNAVELQQKLEGTAEQIDEFLLQFDEVKEASQDAASKVEALENAVSLTSAPPIVASAQGEVVAVTDSADRSLQGLSVYGKSYQDGTPTPDAPVEIESVDSPVVTFNEKNLLDMTWLSSAPETYEHRGITFAPAEEGKTSICGTTTGTYAQVPRSYFSNLNLPVGNYKLKCFAEGTTNNATIRCVVVKDGSNAYTSTANSQATSIEIVEGSIYQAFFYVLETGVTVDCKVSAMIVASNVDTSTYEPYKEGQSLSVVTSSELCGIPVTSGGNYTDDNGQQWICDEIDFARGVKTQRTSKLKVTDEHTVTNYTAVGNCARALITNHGYDVINSTTRAFSNILPWVNSYSSDTPHFYATQNRVWVFVPIAELSTATAAGVKEWLINHNAEFLYALATPIETPLTEEQIADYSALTSYFPTTTVTNDKGAGLKLSYIADTKTYVDNQFKTLFALISSN